MRAAVSAHSPDRIRLIEKSGGYSFNGYGADAQEVLVVPGIKASISIDGHSKVYFLKSRDLVSCSGGSFGGGCSGM